MMVYFGQGKNKTPNTIRKQDLFIKFKKSVEFGIP